MIPIFLSHEPYGSSARSLKSLSNTLVYNQALIVSLAAPSWRWQF